MSEDIMYPEIDETREIIEIAEDFTEPYELFREAISNSYDAGAHKIGIEIYEDETDFVQDKFKIRIWDDGKGMDRKKLKLFWNLGFSDKKDDDHTIGSKGHGTMIYLKAKYIKVSTTCKQGSYISECIEPMRDLLKGKKHKYTIREAPKKYEKEGTEIILEGYYAEENDRRECFNPNAIKDYIIWYTKYGSFEKELELEKESHNKEHFDDTISLKVFDNPEEIIKFGHIFAPISDDTKALKTKYSDGTARDYFVRKYSGKDVKISDKYNYKFDYVIYVEGTAAKKQYNPMISDNKKNIESRYCYKIADRYGIYLCKDYIPIIRANEWIENFGTGSNAFGLLHGFINCQEFKLTANRGSLSIKNKEIMEELKGKVQEVLDEIQNDLYKKGTGDMDILNSYKDEVRTKKQEIQDYTNRSESVREKIEYMLDNNVVILEPKNEIETYTVYCILNTIDQNLFDFIPLDYSSNVGIDMLVRRVKNKNVNKSELQYVEFKHILGSKGFNHGFEHLSYIICWRVDDKLESGDYCVSKFISDDNYDKWKYEKRNDGTFLINEYYGDYTPIRVIELEKIVKERALSNEKLKLDN